MAKGDSSRRWLQRQANDEYVKRAQQEGYRSRAVYKLLEINQRAKILRPGSTIVDLGAAPGSWSQVAAREVGPKGRVVAVDILPMDPLPEVTFLQGDFYEQEIVDKLMAIIKGCSVDLVMSDMAPNSSGMKAIDQPRAMYLAELALEFSQKVLINNGNLLLKLFQGEGFDEFVKEIRTSFKKVSVRKPKASRASSREVYMLALGFNVSLRSII